MLKYIITLLFFLFINLYMGYIYFIAPAQSIYLEKESFELPQFSIYRYQDYPFHHYFERKPNNQLPYIIEYSNIDLEIKSNIIDTFENYWIGFIQYNPNHFCYLNYSKALNEISIYECNSYLFERSLKNMLNDDFKFDNVFSKDLFFKLYSNELEHLIDN